MPDVLAHVLTAYALATLLSARYRWLSPAYATVAMMGAMIPDMTKIRLLFSNAEMEALLGVPFSWDAIHTLGGSTVAVLIGGVLAGERHRRRVVLALALGMLSHHALDALLVRPSGYAHGLFWPLSEYRPPAGMLYHSSDRWPGAVAALAAAGAYVFRRRTVDASEDGATSKTY